MLKKKSVTRDISRAAECELWARAGGRCEFRGCNRPLYRNPLTQERVNLAQKAHIYSFSVKGPRGRGPYVNRVSKINSPENLVLACGICHKTIDSNPSAYPAGQVLQWKTEHEQRIELVTGIGPDLRSHVVLYGSRIHEQDSPLHVDRAHTAMMPDRFPADGMVIDLAMKREHTDDQPEFWESEAEHLRARFARRIELAIEQGAKHFSVFALAGMPLLVLLGSLFTDKREVDVYQFHRNPKGWRWRPDGGRKAGFYLKPPAEAKGKPAVVFSLSAIIAPERIKAVLGNDVAIWEFTVPKPFSDFLCSRQHLAEFREQAAKALVAINAAHARQPVHIFPAMPVACAVELGRVRMPKGDTAWTLYDHHPKHGKFLPALVIGTTHES